MTSPPDATPSSAPTAAARRIAPRELALVTSVSLAWLLLVRAGPLSLPYFWDEADVYVAGARWLADHDLDPTPGHFPDDWSRGHPPLLYVVSALAFRLFGPGPLVGHLVVLPSALLGLVSTYALGLERHGRTVALGATLVLASTPLYLTMGAFLLPEMPLTALTAAALWALHRRSLVTVALLGVAMVWLKETGIFTSGAIGLALLVEHARARTLATRRASIDLALAALPLFALIAFFVWQRVNAGYFVFPHHQGLLAERHFELTSLFTAIPSLLLWHGRWMLTVAAVAALPWALRAHPGLLARPVELASLLLALFNILFFAQMFWLERYALPAHPGLLLLGSLSLSQLPLFHWAPTGGMTRAPNQGLRQARALVIPVLAAVWALASLRASAPDDAPELSFVYADVMRSHARVAAALDERAASLPADPLVVTVWPLTVELRDPVLGFTRHPFRTLHPDHLADHPEARVDVVVVDTSSSNEDRLRVLADELSFIPLETIREGDAPPLELWAPPTPDGTP